MCSTNLQVAAVDLIDYFQVTGQQMSKQVNWPALQSLRKDSVIGVGTGADTDVPGLNTSRGKYINMNYCARCYESNNLYNIVNNLFMSFNFYLWFIMRNLIYQEAKQEI